MNPTGGIVRNPMQVRATTAAPVESGADTICVGVFEGEDAGSQLAGGAVEALLRSGEARRAFRRLALARSDGVRWLVVGLGPRAEFDVERARVAAAVAVGRARELSTETLCWQVPAGVDDQIAAGLVEGTLLAAYRFDRYKGESDEEDGAVAALIVSGPHEIATLVSSAAELAQAQNAARDLQNAPANELTPRRLGERARELAGEVDGLSVDVEGREAIEGRGMGAFAAVARGSDQEPALITLRYEGPGAAGPTLGFVGKAVTFDTGGISIKQAAKMYEMKFDMSGGAAVIEAAGAIARLGLPARVLGVVGSTENMPSGHAMRPGDIVRALNGTTIEINNTDAEGRLVLADCLSYAIEQGAERVVDIATLTGAVVVALGSTQAGLFSNDEALAHDVQEAAAATGERVWRLPLDPEYADLIKGRYADIVNATDVRKALPSAAAEFLKRFVGEVPWAHVDMAGTGWDVDRPYAPSGGSGYGVRLLVELARRASGDQTGV